MIKILIKTLITTLTKKVLLLSIKEWAKEIGINYLTFLRRIHRHGNIPEIYHADNEIDLKAMCQEYGLSEPTIKYRLKKYGNPQNWPTKFTRTKS